MKMKYFIISIISLAVVLFTGCNDDDDAAAAGGDIEITEVLPEGTYDLEVTNLKVTPGANYLSVSWNEPSASDLGGYLVQWKGSSSDNTVYSEVVKKGTKELRLNRVYNEQYQITVKCVSTGLLYSTGTSVSETPIIDNTPPGAVSDWVIDPSTQTITLTWKNPSDDDLEKIVVTVFDITNNQAVSTAELSPITEVYNAVGLTELTEYRITVATYDYNGNFSEVTEDTKTYTEVSVTKVPAWEITGFSSEETSGEGANNGNAKHAIDSDEGTFWHSNWSSGSSLPQYIIFDVKRELIPSKLTYYDRSSGTTSLVRVQGSLDGEEWNDFGSFSTTPAYSGGKECALQSPRLSRYIRFTVMGSTNGYAMIRNIELKELVK